MEKQQVIDYLKDNNTDKVKFAFADIDGVLRGKIINVKKFHEGLEDGYGFCDVVFGWDSNDELYNNSKITGWHTAFPDQPCRIDLSTFRTIPWQNKTPFFLADFSRANGKDLAACPRSLLKRIINECETLGFHPEFAQEFEWFNFRESPDSLQEKGFAGLQPLTPGMFGYSVLRPSLYSDFNYALFNQLKDFDVELEGLHTETGPGVYEAAIIHDHALRAADKAVLLKTAVKEIGYHYNILASFMAKWNAALPGCSGHIHQSLWNRQQTENLFYNAEDPDRMSETLKHYLAGQLYCLPHIMPMYAPTVNSYKRLVEGAWAPTTLSWGIENRTTALRVINSSVTNVRLETRIPGADSNPYLAIAAALASGIYGIRNKLQLKTPPTSGNAYADAARGRLHTNLFDASVAMKSSEIARELFGDDFTDHFTATRLWEWKQFSKQVTDWELKRYFEII